MDELHRSADKFFTEVDHLDRILEDDPTEDSIDLALSQAKRVRRQSAQLVRVLAELRDGYSRRA
jgi:hypothetical protein